MTHFPAGYVTSRLGPKLVIGLSIFLTALLTLATPAITCRGDAPALIASRALMGCLQGLIQPAMSSLLARWFPPRERSMVGSVVYPGVAFGILLSTSLSGLILGSDREGAGWPLVFYLFGGMSMVWVIFWMLLAYDGPRSHPFIADSEKSFLDKEMSAHTRDLPPPIPWRRIFRSKPFLALIIMQTGHDWCSYTVMSDLPKYMSNVLQLPVEITGYASSLHNAGSWVYCILVSWLTDRIINRGHLSRTNARKINGTIASLGTATFLLAAIYAGCDAVLAVTLITIGLTVKGSGVPGVKVNVLDLSPNHAGTLMGLANGIGALTGIFAPYAVGVLAPTQTLSEWNLIFWIMFGVLLAVNVIFLCFASGDVQRWNDLDEANKPDRKEASVIDSSN